MLPLTVTIVILLEILGLEAMGKIVVPKLLDERSEDGRHVVVIDDSMTLRLQKSSVLAERIVVSGFDDDITTPQVIESRELEKDLYEDPDHMASLMMRVGDQGLQLDGMLNPTLKISPLAVTARRRVASGLLHKVELIERASVNCTHASDERNATIVAEHVAIAKRQAATILTSVYPEVSVVSDLSHNTVFNFSELIGYTVIFWNAVNLRYNSFTAPAVRFRVVGIHQMTPEEDVFYIGPASRHVEGVATTRQFATQAPVTKYGNPDLFMLMTGRNLLVSSGGNLQEFDGYGYTGEICGPLNVAIAEDKAGTYKGVHLVAHEAAHLLGVVHDGDGPAPNIPGHPGAQRPGCAWADGYMMSYVDNGPRFSRFSPCAQEQIRVTLNTKTAVCIGESFTYDYLSQFPGRLPGSAFDGNRYCQLSYPNTPGIFYMSPQKPEVLLTCKIQCQTPPRLWDNVFFTYTNAAPDGLPCSNGATCLQSVCTRAPSSG